MTELRPLSVAVLVELVRTPASGGHVKCWERFAAATATVPGVDLTVYVLGPRPAVDPVADNVRFISLRPVLSTARLHGLVGGVDASDLAPFHPGIARNLPRHDVWHVTHSLSFAATALRLRRRFNRPLVTSVHTDVPALVRTYTQQVIDGLPVGLRQVVAMFQPEESVATLARRRRDRLLRASEHVLASNDADAEEFASAAAGVPVSLLRRGLDTETFRPRPDDRPRLARIFGLPPDVPLVLFAGRIDATKGAPLLAEAVLRLRRAGRLVHLVLAGDGAAVPAISRRLGADVTHLGHLPQERLSEVYAACDVFAFPSRSETAGNVVAEAMSAGLPVVLPAAARTARWVRAPGEDGVLVYGDGPEHWASAIDNLIGDPGRRRAIAARARRTVEATVPTWERVVRDDLLPVWERAGGRTSAGRRPPVMR